MNHWVALLKVSRKQSLDNWSNPSPRWPPQPPDLKEQQQKTHFVQDKMCRSSVWASSLTHSLSSTQCAECCSKSCYFCLTVSKIFSELLDWFEFNSYNWVTFYFWSQPSSRWRPQLIDLNQYNNTLNLTGIELKLAVVVAEIHPEHAVWAWHLVWHCSLKHLH